MPATPWVWNYPHRCRHLSRGEAVLKPMNNKFPTGLYAITDPILLPGNRLLSGVESALKGGASVIQYRDKVASEIDRLRAAENLSTLCKNYHAKFIVNDDLALCTRVKADGLHLGKTDGDIVVARKKLGPEKILGGTCHNDLTLAQLYIELGVDYCAFGRVFPSRTKPMAPPCDLSILSDASALNIPIVAIGGINADNIAFTLDYNIHSVAVIDGIFASDDIESAANYLSAQLRASRQCFS